MHRRSYRSAEMLQIRITKIIIFRPPMYKYNMDEKDVNLLKSKKGSWTHPTPLGIVRRRPPQFYNILCHNENFYAIELLNSPQIFLNSLQIFFQ